MRLALLCAACAVCALLWRRRVTTVVVVVPFRDRHAHLEQLLPRLRRHLPGAEVWVSEQAGTGAFNKGAVTNAAVAELLRRGARPDALVLHDVDALPLDTADYTAPPERTVRHLFAGRPDWDWVLGGVSVVRTEDYVRANGFSNRYEGWGREDDDLHLRFKRAGCAVDRSRASYRYADPNPPRFEEAPHDHDYVDPVAVRTNDARLDAFRRDPGLQRVDGLSSVRYSVEAEQELQPGVRLIRMRLS